ncbi:putative Neutral ceramidase [Glarea lozoyensis 74030]|uniref:ceramidase n=1 Tax=Glarea lozoyensis (strain ATCC 74030 / MF5533) TaxID=1104152 RepID=H0EGX2_GLAL7|nr:putative Neutral ceramidase [Glarea lozoyensis 74030]
MAGRRWKSAVAKAAISITTTTPKVVLGGPANTYAHYVTTPEEYGIQRYEGGSTLYGPNELEAYMYLSVSNLKYLAGTTTAKAPAGPSPPDNRKNSISLITGVVYDSPIIFRSWGDVITEPAATYARGAVVNATFVGANPRNNLRLEVRLLSSHFYYVVIIIITFLIPASLLASPPRRARRKWFLQTTLRRPLQGFHPLVYLLFSFLISHKNLNKSFTSFSHLIVIYPQVCFSNNGVYLDLSHEIPSFPRRG